MPDVAIESRSRPSFLFDLDGTLIDSVYQHVLGWREALDQVGHQPLGVEDPPPDRHERRAVRERAASARLETDLDPDTLARPAQAARGGVHPPLRQRPAAARRPRTARHAHRARRAVGDRHQRTSSATPTSRATCSSCRRTPRSSRATRSATPSPTPTCSSPPPNGSASTSATASSSATACGTCSPRAAPARSAIGLLSGGYGREELIYSGAYRVYEDPADLLAHLDEVGVRRPL